MARTAGGQVIDFHAARRARRTEEAAVDLVAAWTGRKVQLLEEASDLAREVLAAGAALSEAADRFRALGACAVERLQQLDQQIEDIDTAIAHLVARGAPKD